MDTLKYKCQFFILTALFLGTGLLLSGCAHTPRTGRFLLHPVPPGGGNYSMSAGAVIYCDEIVEMEVRPLDQRFVGRNLALAGLDDPFTMPDETIPPPLIFEIRLKNKGQDTIYFNPANARGVDDAGERYLPQSFTDYYQFHRGGPAAEKKLIAFTDSCYDGPQQIRAGEETTRYLPFFSYDEIPRMLTLRISLRYGGQTSLNPSFFFEAFPAETE